MMTRLKQWLQKLFSWWRWQEEPEPAPLSADGLSERVEHWREPEPPISPYSPVADEHWDDGFSLSPPPRQVEAGRENTITPAGGEKAFPTIPLSPASLPPPAPIPAQPALSGAQARSEPNQGPEAEHHLEFLRYLVRRGIVNEGFSEDQPPRQYP